MTTGELVYLICPNCKRRIPNPFIRGTGPFALIHIYSRKHASCRLIISVARLGEQHLLEVVPENVAMEVVLLRRWAEERGSRTPV